MKHTIWSNDLDYKDWKDDLESEYPDEDGYSEDDRIRMMYEMNDEYLEDERINLNKELGQPIIMFGDLGLWNGRRSGYKQLGTNLNSIFNGTCGDYVTWYVEDGEIKCNDIHHDGTNHYTYRVLKNGLYFCDFEELLYEIPMADAVKEYTEPLGHYVEEIYGWETIDEPV